MMFLGAFLQSTVPVDVLPVRFTQAVNADPDDPAIWVHPSDAKKSVIYGTDKIEKVGQLVVFNPAGKIIQRIEGLDRPNNVDCKQRLKIGTETVDLVAVTERKKRRLTLFRVNGATGLLTDVTGATELFEGKQDPMGIALYRSPSSGAARAIVSPKEGPTTDHFAQYKLVWNSATQKIDLKLEHLFGGFSGVKETESIVVDDELGFAYCSDETVGTRKFRLDSNGNKPVELSMFNKVGTKGDHEGIAIWKGKGGKGYVVCTDQIEGNSVYRVFKREGNNPFVGAFRMGVDATDGIEIASGNFGSDFPEGIVVAMNSGPKNFALASWKDVAKKLGLK